MSKQIIFIPDDELTKRGGLPSLAEWIATQDEPISIAWGSVAPTGMKPIVAPAGRLTNKLIAEWNAQAASDEYTEIVLTSPELDPELLQQWLTDHGKVEGQDFRISDRKVAFFKCRSLAIMFKLAWGGEQ